MSEFAKFGGIDGTVKSDIPSKSECDDGLVGGVYVADGDLDTFNFDLQNNTAENTSGDGDSDGRDFLMWQRQTEAADTDFTAVSTDAVFDPSHPNYNPYVTVDYIDYV